MCTWRASTAKEHIMARPHAIAIELGEADRPTLQSWMCRYKTAQALALRARIVLAYAEPAAANRAIAKALSVSALRPQRCIHRKPQVHGQTCH